MSGKASGKVWEIKLTPAQQIVLLALADHADHDGRNIRPGVPLIAWKTGYSERQVQRIVKQLMKDGLLVVEKTREGKPTEYSIDFTKGIAKPPHIRRKRGDIALSGDKMSGVTSQGKKENETPDITSGKTSRVLKDEPSLKDDHDGDPVAIRLVQIYEATFGAIGNMGHWQDFKVLFERYGIEKLETACIKTKAYEGKTPDYTAKVLAGMELESGKPKPKTGDDLIREQDAKREREALREKSFDEMDNLPADQLITPAEMAAIKAAYLAGELT